MIEAERRLRPAFLAAMVLVVACSGPTHPRSGLPTGDLVIETDSGEVRLNVEIAESYEAKVKGLMGRRSLPAGAGMVFLAADTTSTGFWMKDTLIPLSVAFWDQEERIRAILDMEPCPAEPCPIYSPGVEWTGAVEVNLGFFGEHGVEVDDPVRLER